MEIPRTGFSGKEKCQKRTQSFASGITGCRHHSILDYKINYDELFVE
jgi:hypothetical protein